MSKFEMRGYELGGDLWVHPQRSLGWDQETQLCCARNKLSICLLYLVYLGITIRDHLVLQGGSSSDTSEVIFARSLFFDFSMRAYFFMTST